MLLKAVLEFTVLLFVKGPCKAVLILARIRITILTLRFCIHYYLVGIVYGTFTWMQLLLMSYGRMMEVFHACGLCAQTFTISLGICTFSHLLMSVLSVGVAILSDRSVVSGRKGKIIPMMTSSLTSYLYISMLNFIKISILLSHHSILSRCILMYIYIKDTSQNNALVISAISITVE